MGFFKSLVSSIFGSKPSPNAALAKQAADKASADRQKLERQRDELKRNADAAKAKLRDSQRRLQEAQNPGLAQQRKNAAENRAAIDKLKIQNAANIRAIGEAETQRRLVEDLLRRAREEEAWRKEEVREQTLAREVLLKARVHAGLSSREYANRKDVSGGKELPELRAFLLGNYFSRFASSNVGTIVYDKKASQLYIKFLPSKRYPSGRWYCYDGIDQALATRMYNAYSHGIWVWDNLRVRGIGNARRTQKPFARDKAPPATLPYDEVDPRSSAAMFGAAGGF